MTFDDIDAQWKSDTRDTYARLIVLNERAQDNGLTDEERKEYKELKEFTNTRLKQFLSQSLKAP